MSELALADAGIGGASPWRTVALGDIVRNCTESVKDPLAAGLERYVALEHLNALQLNIERWGDVHDGTTFTRTFKPGQVLFGKRRAYQRKAAVASFAGVCSGDILVLEPANDALMPELLPFIVHSDAFLNHALGTSAGSLSPRTKWKELAKLEVPLPPLSEQRRIVMLLQRVERSLQTWRRVTAQAQVAEDALANQFFLANPDAATAPCGAVCERITVGIVVQPAKWYVDDGVPALRSLNVLPNRFDLSDVVHLSQEGHEQHRKSEVQVGDVLVVRTGRPGDAAVAGPDIDGINIIDLILARCGPELLPEFLARYLNSAPARRQMARRTVGTAQQHFNVKSLNELNVPLPSLPEQRRVAAALASGSAAVESARGQSDRLLTLRSTLTETLLWGRRDVH